MKTSTSTNANKKSLQIESSSQNKQFGQSASTKASTFARSSQERSAQLSPSNSKTSNGLNSNSTSSKQFKPILRTKDEPQQRTTLQQSSSTSLQMQKSKGSGQVDGKNSAAGSNQVSANGKTTKGQTQTFNYEEKSASKRGDNDNTPNSQVFKRKSPYQMIEKSDSSNNILRKFNDADDIIEIRQDYQGYTNPMQTDLSDLSRLEDRIRPSEEVKYMELNIQGHDDQSILESFALRTKDRRGTTSSFVVMDEGLRSEYKGYNMVVPHQHDDEQFEVIKEEMKDNHHLIMQEIDSRQNSDFKRFNIDDEVQQIQSLRIINQNNLPHMDLTQYNSHKFNPDDVQRLEFLQDTPKHIKDKAYSNRNEEPFQDPNVISPQSFGSPDKSLRPYQHQSQDNLQAYQAHVLSFAQHQHQQQMEYPPLQQNHTILNESGAQFQLATDRPITPTSLMQHQKLNDLMKMSNVEFSSLQTSMVQDKIDEKALNNMIDMEKNYVIQQYEAILQQLNVEFHKLLSKTKETEEQLQSKEALLLAQSKILQDKDQTQFQQEQLNRQLSTQVQELLSELEFLTVQRQKQQQSNDWNENWRIERDMYEQQIHSLQHKLGLFEQNEVELKDQIENANQRLRMQEQKYRQKEEEMYQMTRDNQALQRDYKNVKDIESSLKAEIKSAQVQRIQLEDTQQEMKQQISSNIIVMRQKDADLDTIVRENRALRGTVEALQCNLNDSIGDGNQIRDQITESERVKLQMKSHIDRQERDMQGMKKEIQRLQQVIEAENQQKQSMEDHYRREINRLGQNLKEVQSKLQNQQYNEPNENYNQSRQEQDRQYEANHSSYPNNYLQIENQKPLQDDIKNYYSPQRIAQPANKPFQNQDQFSPQLNQANNTSKSTISWPHMWGVNQANQQSQNKNNLNQNTSDLNKFQLNAPQRDDEGSLKRRQYVNQNESQLHNVLSWDSGSNKQALNHSQSQLKVQRSLERLPQHDKQQFNFFNQPQQQNDQPRTNMRQEQQQSWHQTRSPPHQEPAIPYAGKKSMTQQSPLKDKNSEQQIIHLQNSLSALQIDKERVENEYRKLGVAKNKNQIEKKKELEFDVEIVNKNIQNIRQKLRELNAF